MAEKNPANASSHRLSLPAAIFSGVEAGEKDETSFLPMSNDQNESAKIGVTPTRGGPIPRYSLSA